MPTVIDEHTQFTDSNGLPIASGEIYIGTVNQDPETNTITIYSDRGLTTPITNPQPTDADGRSTNKIWVPGKYSIQVNDSAAVQKYQNLDAGSEILTGISNLTNVQGTNAVTAEGTPNAITSLTDSQIYTFKAVNAPTASTTTLQIDALGAKTIEGGGWAANEIVSVYYNSTSDTFVSIMGTPDVWTPAAIGSSGSPVSETGEGYYSKNGNIVAFQGSLTVTDKGTLSGPVGIDGLTLTPRALSTSFAAFPITVIGFNALSITASESLVGGLEPDGNIYLYIWNATTGVTALDWAEVGNGTNFAVGGTYLLT